MCNGIHNININSDNKSNNNSNNNNNKNSNNNYNNNNIKAILNKRGGKLFFSMSPILSEGETLSKRS